MNNVAFVLSGLLTVLPHAPSGFGRYVSNLYRIFPPPRYGEMRAICCRRLFHSSPQRSYRSLSVRWVSSSVSYEEVSKFSAMSELWWDPRKNPLAGMNPIRMRFMIESLPSSSASSSSSREGPLHGKRALDVGCGGGLLSESLARLGASVTAIDPSRALAEIARQHSQNHPMTASIDYRGGISVEELAAAATNAAGQEKFDVICILEVLEHATDVDSLLKAASSLLAKDGIIFVSTVNKTIKSHLLAIVGAEYIMGYLPIGTHDWDKFLSPEDVSRRMNDNGLEAIDVKGMTATSPPPLGNWNWKLDPKDTDVNWIGAYRFRTK